MRCGPKTQRPACSIPFFFIDDVEQRLTRGEAPAVFQQDRLPFLAIGCAEDRDMRRDQHIGHSPERAVGWQWLGLCDIEAGTCELAGL